LFVYSFLLLYHYNVFGEIKRYIDYPVEVPSVEDAETVCCKPCHLANTDCCFVCLLAYLLTYKYNY